MRRATVLVAQGRFTVHADKKLLKHLEFRLILKKKKGNRKPPFRHFHDFRFTFLERSKSDKNLEASRSISLHPDSRIKKKNCERFVSE